MRFLRFGHHSSQLNCQARAIGRLRFCLLLVRGDIHRSFSYFLKIPKVGKHKRADLPRYLRPCLQAAFRPLKTHTRHTQDTHKKHNRGTQQQVILAIT
jgi:hypothetical protein